MSTQDDARMESLRKGTKAVTRRDLKMLDKYTRNVINSLTDRVTKLEELLSTCEGVIKDKDQIDLLEEESQVPKEEPKEEKKKRGRPTKKDV